MGSPPEYSAGDEEQADPSRPLLGTSPQPGFSYPPVQPSDQDDESPPVIYVYNPRYPATGDNQRLMGTLSHSREDTITMVQAAISSLADVDRSRIQFNTLINPLELESQQKWARVLDEVWVKMVKNRPHTLEITLEDRPEDKAKRDKRNLCICFSVIGLIIAIILAGILGAYLTSGHGKTKS